MINTRKKNVTEDSKVRPQINVHGIKSYLTLKDVLVCDEFSAFPGSIFPQAYYNGIFNLESF